MLTLFLILIAFNLLVLAVWLGGKVLPVLGQALLWTLAQLVALDKKLTIKK